uniref:Uncharacterized protein n=1 Tax=Tetranychus urticae TaxID=32264 RepID=T1L0S1_TETUR
MFSCVSGPLTRSAPLEDGFLLRQLASGYTAPLVASFLHLRLQNAIKSVEDIKNSVENLSESHQNLLTLKLKSLEALDKQLTSLQKADYFQSDGTEQVKKLIEQYMLNNVMIPIEFGPDKTQFKVTPDDLLKKLGMVSNDNLIRETNDLVNVYLKDIEEKESNEKYNELQRLFASLTKRQLEPLVNFQYSWPTDTLDQDGHYLETRDYRGPQIESVLSQLKIFLDYFYSQFENLKTLRVQSSSWERPIKVKSYPSGERYI